jgi:hypothetical protein
VFEIGNSLREARLRRHVDFAQAELATKIRGKYLRALEDEQFDVLPAQTYVKGFLRTYAEYLGLDGQLYVDEYNSRFVTGDDAEFRLRRSSVRPQRRNRRLEMNVVLVALALIAVVTIVVIGAWTSHKSPAVPTVAQRRAVTPKTQAVPPLLWVRAVRGDSFLAVHDATATGRIRYEGTLGRGRPPLQVRGRRLWLNIGSPENLTIRIRGRLVHVTGHRPRVILVTATGWRPA